MKPVVVAPTRCRACKVPAFQLYATTPQEGLGCECAAGHETFDGTPSDVHGNPLPKPAEWLVVMRYHSGAPNSFTSSRVAAKYVALYGEPDSFEFVETLYPFRCDGIGTVILPPEFAKGEPQPC